tara:strand:- start:4525 stop:5301 length:777 start_codon:yes stop_codon:yes gene_type:complete
MLAIIKQRNLAMNNIENGYVFPTNGGCKAKVINYTNSKNVLIEFQDKHKYQTVTTKTHIKSGSVKNPYQPSVAGMGYVGVGRHVASVGTKSTPEYMLWKQMIYRCYDRSQQERQPTYKGCTVCDEWLNFQNFAEWLSAQSNYKDGYELDKDLVLKGNKQYSPKACRFIPKKLNVILNNCEASRGQHPLGVCFNKNENRFAAAIRIDGKKKGLGYFDTASEAYEVYVDAKESYVKSEAQRFKGDIDDDVFNALMSWKVG